VTDADLLFTGGGIFGAGTADALAVADGRIAAVGDAARELSAAEHVDLVGGALLPGFGDGHVHPLWGGVEAAEAPVRECTSVDQVVEAVRAYAAARPELKWVTGGSYDPSLAPDGAFDATWLDAAVPDRPVVLTSADHHVVWCNSAALRRAGITADTPDPPSAVIVRRDDGSPLGTLREWGAMALVTRHIPPTGRAAKAAGLAHSTGLLAAAGVTWAQEAALAPEDVASYLSAADAGKLSVRVNIALRADPDRWRAQRAEFRDARALGGRAPAGEREHGEVLRRRRRGGRDGGHAGAVRGRAGELRAPRMGAGRAHPGGDGLRRRRLPGAHPRHR
jgi:predicted amidohydrolase YtcJ